MTPEEKQSGIPCVLIGTDGNIYALLGRARQAVVFKPRLMGIKAQIMRPVVSAVNTHLRHLLCGCW